MLSMGLHLTPESTIPLLCGIYGALINAMKLFE